MLRCHVIAEVQENVPDRKAHITWDNSVELSANRDKTELNTNVHQCEINSSLKEGDNGGADKSINTG